MFKNQANAEVVSHSELKGILTEFKHSMIGSVRASMLDAMRLQRLEKERAPPVLTPQVQRDCMMDTDSELDLSEDSDSEIEAW